MPKGSQKDRCNAKQLKADSSSESITETDKTKHKTTNHDRTVMGKTLA